MRQQGVALLEMEEALIGGALGKYEVQYFDLFPNHLLALQLKKRPFLLLSSIGTAIAHLIFPILTWKKIQNKWLIHFLIFLLIKQG